jgi:16S rRNA processing protein RimM
VDTLIVAELGKPHGIRGEITARLRGVTVDELAAISSLRVRGADDSEAPVRVSGGRPRSAGWILRIDGVNDRDEAEAFRGAVILAPRQELPAPEPGEWWVDDLIGLEVVSDDGEPLGRLTEVLKLPANDVFVVRSDVREVLLPAIDDVILAVDLEEKKMTVHLLPGLIEEADAEAG